MRNSLLILLILMIIMVGFAYPGIAEQTGDVNKPVTASFSVTYESNNLSFACGILSGTVYPRISGLCPSGKPGAPMLPMDIHTIILPGRWDVTGVGISDSRRESIPGVFNVVPNAKPFRLQRNRQPMKGMNGTDDFCLPDPAIYGVDAFFPGHWLAYTAGYDGENTLVFIRVYPLQYNPKSGKLELLTSCDISIHADRVEITTTKSAMSTDAENIIITTAEFSDAAESLRDAHESWDISTAIIYCDSISESYEPAPEPIEYLGYAHDSLRPTFLDTYDYNLALEIIAYLRDDAAHPNLATVTILGDASDIPPSYYVAFGDYGEDWQRIAPTDAFYASPDYDFIPNFGIGRLPAGNNAQAHDIIQKLVDTYNGATTEWLGSAYFTGGSPWHGTYYESEIYITSIHNAGFCDALESERSYCSEGGFNYTDWSTAWQSGSHGIFWILAHGSGQIFAFDDYDDTPFGITDFVYYPIDPPYPILFGGNCSNGIFDQDIIEEIDMDTTFSEAFIFGSGGGSMLIASTRVAYGYTGYYIEDYETYLDYQKYLPEVGYRMMESISESPATCGELFKNTMTYFVENAEMLEDTITLLTYFEMIMHGDPALPLPEIETDPIHNPRPGVEFGTTPTGVTSNGAAIFHGDFPVVQINIDGGLEPVYAKALYGQGEAPVYLTEIISGEEYDFPVSDGVQYTSLRIESADGKARWLYFLTCNGELLPDGEISDWIEAEIEPTRDPDDFAENYLELTDLYGYMDDNNLYVAFPFFEPGDSNRGYTLCIDNRSGGAADNSWYGDASWTYVNFPGRAPDYEMVFNVYYDHYSGRPVARYSLYEYNETDYWWNWINFAKMGACASVNLDSGFIEASLNLDSLRLDEDVAVIVYSFPLLEDSWNPYPSQDATPYNSGSHTSLISTETPNELTEWLVLDAGDIKDDNPVKPTAPTLAISPNPFNSSIRFQVSGVGSQVSVIEIYDLRGTLIDDCKLTIDDSQYPASITDDRLPITEFIWQPDESIGSGIYLVRVKTGNRSVVRKIALIK